MKWNIKNKKGIKEWKDALLFQEDPATSVYDAYFTSLPKDQKLDIIQGILEDGYAEVVDSDTGYSMLVPKEHAKDIEFLLNAGRLAVEQATEWNKPSK